MGAVETVGRVAGNVGKAGRGAASSAVSTLAYQRGQWTIVIITLPILYAIYLDNVGKLAGLRSILTNGVTAASASTSASTSASNTSASTSASKTPGIPLSVQGAIGSIIGNTVGMIDGTGYVPPVITSL